MKRLFRGGLNFFPVLIFTVLLLPFSSLRAQEASWPEDSEDSFEPWDSGESWDAPESWDASESWDAPESWDPGEPEEAPPPEESGEDEYSAGVRQKEYPPLPRSFRNIALGMGLEELKGILAEDNLFQFRGDRDVSFLPARDQSLVETTGPSFIRRAFFQLREGDLFVMAFNMDPALVDHYSVFRSFVEKYGEPELLDPRQAVWESEDVRISIERPLTVKYIDKTVFNDILDESRAKESGAIRLREEFLNEF